MIANSVSEVERLIADFIEQRQKSLHHHKKKNDAEKEYNKLLVNYGGEEKNFTLEQANKIYNAYQEMTTNEEQSRTAETLFNEAHEKLKELGRILFHATITADITIPAVNGEVPRIKEVRVTFPNGEVLVV